MHWTYTTRQPHEDLEQGDFLVPTDHLRSVLSEVHPHFCSSKYIGFSVSTQSCDLVRRKGNSPKAHYINIASVRSLKEVFPRLISHFAKPIAEGVFCQSHKQAAKEFLSRLFNQNEQSIGLFYFHPDADIGLGEASVAFLRVSVALRAEHYDVLLDARRGGLTATFQAKFGWLVGNLYSRAATPDWSDRPAGDNELQSLITYYLEEQLPGFGPVWIEDELVAAGRRANVLFEDRDLMDLKDELEQYRPEPALKRLIKEVQDEAARALTFHKSRSTVFDDVYAATTRQVIALVTNAIYQRRSAALPEEMQLDAFVEREIADILLRLKDESMDLFDALMRSKILKLANRLQNSGRVKKLVR